MSWQLSFPDGIRRHSGELELDLQAGVCTPALEELDERSRAQVDSLVGGMREILRAGIVRGEVVYPVLAGHVDPDGHRESLSFSLTTTDAPASEAEAPEPPAIEASPRPPQGSLG